MSLIEKILGREEFREHPPVLIDIGASGDVHAKWKKIAKHSVCVSFDADDREIGYLVNEAKNFRKQYVYNCIVAEKKSDARDFYLTRSPYCSATLEPDIEKLNDYSFAELFEVEKKVSIKAIDLPTVIGELGLAKIDWFKTDSQGTDLRLFQSIGPELIKKVLVAEFEPGFIDAYKGEDKLHALLAYMDQHNFWLSDMTVKGSQRINRATKNKRLSRFPEKMLRAMIRKSPGWAEVVYFNSFRPDQLFDKRDFLLGWVFAIIQKQPGFALDLAIRGKEKFNDPVFSEMENHAYNKIISGMFNLPFYAIGKSIEKIFG